jgi:hypothetical protein
MRWKKANQNKSRKSLIPAWLVCHWQSKSVIAQPEPQYIIVSLCCRDGQGNFEGKVYSVHVSEIEIECDFMEGIELVYLDGNNEPHWFPSQIKIINKTFPVNGCRQYYGNLCWDGVEMAAETVIEMLNYLMDERCDCDCAPTEIFNAWDSKEHLTTKHIPLLVDDFGDSDYYHFMR